MLRLERNENQVVLLSTSGYEKRLQKRHKIFRPQNSFAVLFWACVSHVFGFECFRFILIAPPNCFPSQRVSLSANSFNPHSAWNSLAAVRRLASARTISVNITAIRGGFPHLWSCGVLLTDLGGPLQGLR